MPETMLLTCQHHIRPLTPSAAGGALLTCPEPGCAVAVRIMAAAGPVMPVSPLTPLAQTAAAHNEFVTTYVASGFSRAEAMQLLTGVLQAAVMKGAGNG